MSMRRDDATAIGRRSFIRGVTLTGAAALGSPLSCHGRAGQGGSFNYPTPVLARIQWPVEAFRAFSRVGVNDMPAYSKDVLSDQQVADVHTFLQALAGSRSAAEIPLLNQ
jgi:mono/diheme cytochrome c family protein